MSSPSPHRRVYTVNPSSHTPPPTHASTASSVAPPASMTFIPLALPTPSSPPPPSRSPSDPDLARWSSSSPPPTPPRPLATPPRPPRPSAAHSSALPSASATPADAAAAAAAASHPHAELRTPPLLRSRDAALIRALLAADAAPPADGSEDRNIPLAPAVGSSEDERGPGALPRPPLPPKRLLSPVPYDKLFWFEVDEFGVADVPDADTVEWVEMATVTGRIERRLSEPAGRRVRVNGHDIVLFRYCSEWFAVAAACPHQGANLELADIEDLAGEPALRCPRHKWRFSLRTGTGLLPASAAALCLRSYPVIITPTGRISLGFDALSPDLMFNEDF